MRMHFTLYINGIEMRKKNRAQEKVSCSRKEKKQKEELTLYMNGIATSTATRAHAEATVEVIVAIWKLLDIE